MTIELRAETAKREVANLRSSIPTKASHVVGEATSWAWEERIPFGDITMVAGRDGAAKSTFGCYLAAAWSNGMLTGESENVHIIMAEDHIRRVVKPRLEVAGANLSRVILEPNPTRFQFPSGADALEVELQRSKSRIVIIDPVDSFIRKASRGRAGIDELKALADRLDVAVLMFHHFNRKVDPLDLNGSIGGGRGLMAAVRSRFAWGRVVAPPNGAPEADRLYGLIHLKSSYAEEQDPLLFEGRQFPNPYSDSATLLTLVDHGEYPLTGENLFPVESGARQTKVEKAQTLILDLLESHSEGMRAPDLESEVLSAGFKSRVFEQARAMLATEGVIEKTRVEGEGWYWTFAQVPDTIGDLA